MELLLEDSLESSKKLPTEISDIFKIATFRFNKFKNGNFSVQYEFDLVNNNLILSNNGPDYLKTLTFNPIQSKDFLQSYIDFVFLEKGLEKTQSDIKRIYEVLGN